jgi:3',5'-cyclic AMP phosphodiesterase CpdA
MIRRKETCHVLFVKSPVKDLQSRKLGYPNRIRDLILVLTLCLVCITACKTTRQFPFSFVQLCDPQLGMGGYEHDKASLGQAVKQINELECDFVVVCGDLVHHPADSSFQDFLDITGELDMPCYLVAGNHDVGNIPGDSSLAYYREKLGDDYYTFKYGRKAFVVVNTQLWKNHVEGASAAHDQWFRKVLDDFAGRQIPVIVIGHHPLFVEEVNEEEAYFNLPLEKRMEILRHFVESGVVAYLSGHRHETLINDYQGIQLVTGESTSRNFDGRPLGFRLWEVDGDSLQHHFVALSLLIDTTLKE